MDSKNVIAGMTTGLDESTRRLVTEGLKDVKNEMDRRAYAEAVVEIYDISQRVGRKAAEDIWKMKTYGDMRTYAKIVKFWAARNAYDAVDGAEMLPTWLSKVGNEDKDNYAELVMSVERPVFLSIEFAKNAADLHKREREDYGKDYAKLLRDIGSFCNRDMAITNRKEALDAASKIFGLLRGGNLKEAESYGKSLAGQTAEIGESTTTVR